MRPLCSAEQNQLCNFGRGHHEEQFCEIILNLDQWFKRYRLKIFLVWSAGRPFVQRSGNICAILVEGILRNNYVKLFRIRASGSEVDVVKRYFLSGALAALLFSGAETFVQFW